MVQAERKLQLPVGGELGGLRKIRGENVTDIRTPTEISYPSEPAYAADYWRGLVKELLGEGHKEE